MAIEFDKETGYLFRTLVHVRYGLLVVIDRVDVDDREAYSEVYEAIGVGNG